MSCKQSNLLSKAGMKFTTETVCNCWHHTGILLNTELLDDIEADNDPILDEISKALNALKLPNSMPIEEFLNIPEENIMYEVPEDIAEFIEMFKKKYEENTDDLDEVDDSTEVVTISTNVALKSLSTVHTFLLQQENLNEHIKLVNTIENFVRRKQTQTTINQYFG